jgi:secreted trypsin-like serine protease
MQGDRQATKQEQEGKYAFVAKLSYADPASNATAYMKSSERDVAEQYCSGALVADNTVVTTASCCDFRKKSGVRVTVNGLTSTVKEMVWVDRYGFNPRSERYNLCKLTLEKKVPAATAKPIRLDSSGMEPLPDKTMLTMAGYGEKGEMQVLMVPKVDELECNALGAYNNRISTVEFCVGPSPNKSPEDDFACQGDMGSPIVHEANGELILTGLASSGNGCRTPKSFAIATKISTLVGWIGLPEHAAKEGDESAKYGSKSA